jgi:transcriptional regulator
MPPREWVDRKRVLELLEKGSTQTQIARRLGISKVAVCNVAKEAKR